MRRLLLALAAMLATISLALAATTTTPVSLAVDQYTDLGAGPMWLGANGGPVIYQIADSKPANSAAGNVEQLGSPAIKLDTSAHVWAYSPTAGTKAIVTAGTGLAGVGSVSVNGNSGTPTQTSVSVGTSSGLLLAAGEVTSFLKLCIALTAANGIWVRWDGQTATAAPPSEYIWPGKCAPWIKPIGYLPTSQINAIASATVAVTLIHD